MCWVLPIEFFSHILDSGNIGFDSAGTLKIFDFDLARVLPKTNDKDETFQLTAKVGSPRYMAPEVVNGEPYNLKADVFSFGLLAYQIITGKTPFRGIQFDWSKSNSKIPKTWTSDVRFVLERAHAASFRDRPTMAMCVKELEFLNTTKKDDATLESSSDPFGCFCGVALDDFNELLGCGIAGGEEQEEEED